MHPLFPANSPLYTSYPPSYILILHLHILFFLQALPHTLPILLSFMSHFTSQSFIQWPFLCFPSVLVPDSLLILTFDSCSTTAAPPSRPHPPAATSTPRMWPASLTASSHQQCVSLLWRPSGWDHSAGSLRSSFSKYSLSPATLLKEILHSWILAVMRHREIMTHRVSYY